MKADVAASPGPFREFAGLSLPVGNRQRVEWPFGGRHYRGRQVTTLAWANRMRVIRIAQPQTGVYSGDPRTAISTGVSQNGIHGKKRACRNPVAPAYAAAAIF